VVHAPRGDRTRGRDVVSRVPVNHVRAGRGEPLVLVHGIGHHLQGWDPVARILRDEFDVLAVDSPGFGRSAPLPAGVPPTVASYADAFAAWFGELGLERPHVAGNSMGGAIALELARRGAVRTATAISPAGFWSDGERRFCQLSLAALTGVPGPARPLVRRLAGTAAGRTALGGQLFARPWRMPGAEFQSVLDDAWGSPVFAEVLAAFDDYDFAHGEELPADVPVTVAWGSRDHLLLYGPQARRARERLPQATHVTLAGLGHTPFFDDPGLVAGAIRAGASKRP
jgi:pimeloyl-ACP methyl ester carboxylesterase